MLSFFPTSLFLFLSIPTYIMANALSLSLSLSLSPSLCACMQMDELDPADEQDEIALNALHQIGSQANTGQH